MIKVSRIIRCVESHGTAARASSTAAAAAALLALLSFASAPTLADIPSLDRVRVLEPGREISGATQLTDQEGRPFALRSLRGQVVLLLFGYTNCPDVCPASMERLRALHDSGTLDGQEVAYLLVSVDGERDTPAVMKAFIEKYSADFVGLTAPPSRVKPIAAKFSAAFFKGEHMGHGAGDYLVSHSPQIFVIDRAGRLRAEFYAPPVETMANVVLSLLAERE